MVNLTNNYKMMIDFKECLCDTDAFVMTNIFDMLKKGVNLPFKKLLPFKFITELPPHKFLL